MTPPPGQPAGPAPAPDARLGLRGRARRRGGGPRVAAAGGPARRRRGVGSASCGTGPRPPSAPRRAMNLRRVVRGPRRDRPRTGARPSRRHAIPRRSSGSSGPRSGMPPATTSRCSASGALRPRHGPRADPDRGRRGGSRGAPGAEPRRSSSGCTSAPSSCRSRSCPAFTGHPVMAPMETVDDPALAALVRGLPRAGSASTSSRSATPGGRCSAPSGGASRSASSRTAT